MGLIRTIKKVAPGGLEKGEEAGQEEQKKKLVLSLVTQLGMSDEQASEVAQVSVSFVKEIRAELAAKK
jgi:transposase